MKKSSPFKINLHELLLENRSEAVEKGLADFSEKMAWKAWRVASMHRMLMNTASGKLKNKIVNKIFTSWNRTRGDLNFSEKTFNQLWKERHKK